MATRLEDSVPKEDIGAGGETSNEGGDVSVGVIDDLPRRTIRIVKGTSGFGFNIRGGCDAPYVKADSGIFVVKIPRDGAAYRDGRLRAGDKIVSLNGQRLENLTHEEAVSLFVNADDELVLEVIRGAGPVLRELDSLMRSASFPDAAGDRIEAPRVTSSKPRQRKTKEDCTSNKDQVIEGAAATTANKRKRPRKRSHRRRRLENKESGRDWEDSSRVHSSSSASSTSVVDSICEESGHESVHASETLASQLTEPYGASSSADLAGANDHDDVATEAVCGKIVEESSERCPVSCGSVSVDDVESTVVEDDVVVNEVSINDRYAPAANVSAEESDFDLKDVVLVVSSFDDDDDNKLSMSLEESAPTLREVSTLKKTIIPSQNATDVKDLEKTDSIINDPDVNVEVLDPKKEPLCRKDHLVKDELCETPDYFPKSLGKCQDVIPKGTTVAEATLIEDSEDSISTASRFEVVVACSRMDKVEADLQPPETTILEDVLEESLLPSTRFTGCYEDVRLDADETKSVAAVKIESSEKTSTSLAFDAKIESSVSSPSSGDDSEIDEPSMYPLNEKVDNGKRSRIEIDDDDVVARRALDEIDVPVISQHVHPQSSNSSTSNPQSSSTHLVSDSTASLPDVELEPSTMMKTTLVHNNNNNNNGTKQTCREREIDSGGFLGVAMIVVACASIGLAVGLWKMRRA